MSNQPEGPFKLVVPSLPAHVATARLFIASLGRTLGLHAEVIDDLRLAVSEAVTAAVIADRSPEVTVSGTISPEGVSVRVGPLLDEDTAGAAPLPGDPPSLDLGSIIRGLFPNAAFEGDALVITVSWRPPT